MHRTLFAALASTSAVASGASAHNEQRPLPAKDLVMMDQAADAGTSEFRSSEPASAHLCPEAPVSHDWWLCPPDVGPQVAQAHTMGQTPSVGCALPSEPWGIPAALDAAITGPADKDRACMEALLIPDARITSVSVGADGSTNYKLLTLDDWIARTKARGHIMLEEKQLNFRVDRFGAIAHLWSLYALRSDGHAVARGINSIQAIKEAGGWRIAGIMVQAESAAAPLPEEYLP